LKKPGGEAWTNVKLRMFVETLPEHRLCLHNLDNTCAPRVFSWQCIISFIAHTALLKL